MNKKNSIGKLLGKPQTPYEKFHAKTMLSIRRHVEVPYDKWPKEWKEISYKGYPRLGAIQLPKKHLPPQSLENVLKQRISGRRFSRKKISLEKLGMLFQFAAGQRKGSIHRYYPSAGARYPLELYFISTNTELPNGVYHYYVRSHCLELVLDKQFVDFSIFANQPWIKNAGGILVISSQFKRTTNKYGDRGYRFVNCESGHLGQNIYLLSSCLDLTCCGIGGFDDTKINEILGINGMDETSLYCFAVGARAR